MIFDRLFGRNQPLVPPELTPVLDSEELGPDGFPLPATPEARSAHLTIGEFFLKIPDLMNYRTCKPVQDEACRWMLDKPREELAALLPFLLERKAWIAKNGKKDTAGECSKSGSYYFALGNLTGWILKRDLSCSPEQVLAIIKSMLTTSEINISGVLHLANK